jgi:F-type H+-transporting ATPase subunit b
MTAGAKITRTVALVAMLLGPCPTALAQEGQSLTQFDRWWNGLWAVGLFIALLALLRTLAWKPLLRVIADREESIRAALREAESQRAESDKLLAEYRARLGAAQEEIAGMAAQAKRDAESARQHILDEARHGASATVAQAQREIGLAKRDSLEEIYRTTADLAASMAQKILAREINPDDHRRMIAESVEAMRSRA